MVSNSSHQAPRKTSENSAAPRLSHGSHDERAGATLLAAVSAEPLPTGDGLTGLERAAMAGEHFGLIVRRLREHRNWSVRRLCEAAGVSDPTVVRQEGRAQICWNHSTTIAVCRALMTGAPMTEAAVARFLGFAGVAHLAGLVVSAAGRDGESRADMIASLAVDAFCSLEQTVDLGRDVQRLLDSGADGRAALGGYLVERNMTNFEAARCVAIYRLAELGVAGLRAAVQAETRKGVAA